MLLIVVVLGAYYPSLFAPLNSVDDPGMYSYLLNLDDFSLRGIFTPGGVYYRPLLFLSFLFDKYVWGLEVSFLHLDNILLHLCNVFIVYAITKKTCTLECFPEKFIPLCSAILFAIHPIATESVTWISGRTDLLAGFFILLSALFLLNRPLTIYYSLISAFALLLACLSKETAIFFLPAAIIIPFFLPTVTDAKASFFQRIHRSIPHFTVFIFLGVGFLMFRSFAAQGGDKGLEHVVTKIAGEQTIDFLISTQMLLKAIGFYFKKLVFPFPLNFGIVHVSDIYVPIGVGVCLSIVWLVTRRRSLSSYFYFSALSVASSTLLILLLRITWTPLAERYMYISSAFFVIGTVISIRKCSVYLQYQKQLTIIVLAISLIAFYGTYTRNILWQDNLALYRDTVRKSPDFMPAQNELAAALKQRGNLKDSLEIYKTFQMRDDVINSQYAMMGKSGAYADNNDFVTARNILENILKKPGKLEVPILERMLEINKIEILRGRTTGSVLYADNVKRLSRLYEITADPFYQYRLGIVHLHEKNNKLALQAFIIVTKTATPTVYYRKPAEKLARDLEKSLEKQR